MPRVLNPQTPVGMIGAVFLYCLITLLQMSVLVGVLIVAAIAASSVLGEGETADNIATGVGLAAAVAAAFLTEPILKNTPIEWLRLSQNPILSMLRYP